MTQMEIKANDSLTFAETIQNDFKKKIIKVGNDIIKIGSLKDQVDSSLKA